MKVEQLSKDNWSVKITEDDEKNLASIISDLKSKIKCIPYGKWKDMTSEEVWEEILIQFCVRGGARRIEKLRANKERYKQFLEKLSVDMLVRNVPNRQEFIAENLKEFKATRFHNRVAKPINNCLDNEDVVKDGRLVLLDNLKTREIDEDEMRSILLKRLPSFKMKSISDFMITIGASRNFIAFDTRVVGLFINHFGLNKTSDQIQSNKILYKTLEERLREVCRKLGIELSLLDRILFNFDCYIEYMFRNQVYV